MKRAFCCLLISVCLISLFTACTPAAHRPNLGMEVSAFFDAYNQLMQTVYGGYPLLKPSTYQAEGDPLVQFSCFPSDYLTVSGYANPEDNQLAVLYIVNSNNTADAATDMQQHTLALAAAVTTLDNTVTNDTFPEFLENLLGNLNSKNTNTITQNGFVYTAQRTDEVAVVTIAPQGEKTAKFEDQQIMWKREGVYPSLLLNPAEFRGKFNDYLFAQKIDMLLPNPSLANSDGQDFFTSNIGEFIEIDGPIDSEGNVIAVIVSCMFEQGDEALQMQWNQCIFATLAAIQPDLSSTEISMLMSRLALSEETAQVTTTYYSMLYSVMEQDGVFAFSISPNYGS